MVEITIALGIVAFALVAIMGLFPVAMKNALDSQNETRATFIAQSIFSDLEIGPTSTNTFLAVGTNWSSQGDRLAIDLTKGSTNYLKYSEEGTPIGAALNQGTFDAGIGGVIYGARVFVTPASGGIALSRVEVQVESPLSAPTAGRTKYHFVTLLPNNRVNAN